VGCRETVKDGVNGYLIPVKSPKALAEKISLLAADPELRKKMGRESRALAEKRFSLANVISRHFSIYESLLANPSSSK
jgi:glycosyltransferase involved in cell wall biosynthesis